MVDRLALLDSLPGIALALDAEFRVIAGGWANWDAFWQANGGAADAPPVVGRDLTLAFSAGPLRAAFRVALSAVLTGERRDLRLSFGCDSPDLQRRMRLSVTRWGPRHLLYRSRLIWQRPWPQPRAPAAPCCAVCAGVKPADPAALDWLSPTGAPGPSPAPPDLCPRCHLALAAA